MACFQDFSESVNSFWLRRIFPETSKDFLWDGGGLRSVAFLLLEIMGSKDGVSETVLATVTKYKIFIVFEGPWLDFQEILR